MNEATFNGGAAAYTNGGSLTVALSRYSRRFHSCYGANITFTLPAQFTMGLGGPSFYISNHTASTITIKAFNGTTLGTVAQNTVTEVVHIRQTNDASGWRLQNTQLYTPRNAYRQARDAVATLPARCVQARFMLVPCNNPTIAVYSNDDELSALLNGGVIRIDNVCYRVYSVRNSREHGYPVPDDAQTYPSCKYCMDGAGQPNGGVYQKGDGDDSGYDPKEQDKVIKWTVTPPDPGGPPQVIVNYGMFGL